MIESELRDRLRALEAESDPVIEQRAWETVRSAYSSRSRQSRPRPSRRRGRGTLAVSVASALVLAALTFTLANPPREAMGRWLRDAIAVLATPHPRPLLAGLPGGGELLINSAAGPWIVRPDGHRRYLGAYTAATWSPHSLYVVAWRGSQLDALSPRGQREWMLTATGTIAAARWSTDGYRIAYLAGRALWVVAGDGTGNHELRASVGAVSPAWQPHTGSVHRIVVTDRAGRIRLLDADSGAQLWSIRPATAIRTLSWFPDGNHLLAVSARGVALYDSQGHLLAGRALSPGQTLEATALAPAGNTLALVVHGADGSSVEVLRATGDGLEQPAAVLFSTHADLDGISWSPDARWLLVSSPSADQWTFLRSQPPSHLQSIGHIRRQFALRGGRSGRVPALGGWQSTPQRPQLAR
jgi:WD40 repeat protein